jgi:hypothetical protein
MSQITQPTRVGTATAGVDDLPTPLGVIRATLSAKSRSQFLSRCIVNRVGCRHTLLSLPSDMLHEGAAQFQPGAIATGNITRLPTTFDLKTGHQPRDVHSDSIGSPKAHLPQAASQTGVFGVVSPSLGLGYWQPLPCTRHCGSRLCRIWIHLSRAAARRD